MKKSLIPFFQNLLLILGGLLGAQIVSINSELNTAISKAVLGTPITLVNGTWTNVQINIQKTGTSSNSITIQAHQF